MARETRESVFVENEVGAYHVYNRVVRRAFLCGHDPFTNKNYDYRRVMLLRRFTYLSHFFSIDFLAYAIMSNHFHLVLRNRPDLVEKMDDREVARRWLNICPIHKAKNGNPIPPTEELINAVVALPEQITKWRKRLSNPSWLMRCVCQHVSRRCNIEDRCTGKFFEERFKMKRLLDEASVLACMTYVDLNPIRANQATTLNGYEEVSIAERLRTLDGSPVDTRSWLAPLELDQEVNGEPVVIANRLASPVSERIASEHHQQSSGKLGCLPMKLHAYAALLRWLAGESRPELKQNSKEESDGIQSLEFLGLEPNSFAQAVLNYENQFSTAVGCTQSLAAEARRRRRRRLKSNGCSLLDRCQTQQINNSRRQLTNQT